MPKTRKVYLGDSVYAEFTGWSVVLTTENGMGPTNTIHLEPATYNALAAFVDTLPDPEVDHA